MGAGPLVVSYLSLSTDKPQQEVVGTALAAILPTFAVGAVSHWRMGNMRLTLVPLLCVGTVTGSIAGACVALHLVTDDSVLK